MAILAETKGFYLALFASVASLSWKKFMTRLELSCKGEVVPYIGFQMRNFVINSSFSNFVRIHMRAQESTHAKLACSIFKVDEESSQTC